jgi:hypothetical protein
VRSVFQRWMKASMGSPSLLPLITFSVVCPNPAVVRPYLAISVSSRPMNSPVGMAVEPKSWWRRCNPVRAQA